MLKTEQETAVKELLKGNDVLAVLPTGFGKSIIFMAIFKSRNGESRNGTERNRGTERNEKSRNL